MKIADKAGQGTVIPDDIVGAETYYRSLQSLWETGRLPDDPRIELASDALAAVASLDPEYFGLSNTQKYLSWIRQAAGKPGAKRGVASGERKKGPAAERREMRRRFKQGFR